MLNVLLTSSVSFLITFFTIPATIIIAQQKKLYDVPDARKLHTRPISSLGGVGIFGGFFLAAMLSVSIPGNPEFQYYMAAATAIFFLGIKDDILILSPTKKFIIQLLAAGVVIHFGGLQIASMHGLMGVYELPQSVSLALTYASIIVIVNAFNLIDGVDGLAGSLGLLTTCLFGAYFFVTGFSAYALFAFAMAGSLSAFLIFNFNPARIFMGDSGSLLLGLVNAILVLKFIAVADGPAAVFPLQSAVAIGFALLMVPLSDTLRVFSIRIFQGRSPFSPDRNHIHHLLLDRGFTAKQVVFCCVGLNILFIGIAFFARSIGPNYLILLLTSLACALLAALVYLKKPLQAVRVAPSFSKDVISFSSPANKVVSLVKEAAISDN